MGQSDDGNGYRQWVYGDAQRGGIVAASGGHDVAHGIVAGCCRGYCSCRDGCIRIGHGPIAAGGGVVQTQCAAHTYLGKTCNGARVG